MSRSATPPTNDPPATHSVWLRLDRTQWTTLIVTIGVFGALVFPRVIWAPCLGDPGEVQLTAAIGGLGHPPGHAGIITIFRVFCLLSPIAPHLTVSAVNAVFALAAVAILMVLMMRSGVNPVAAALASFLFLSDDQFWHASITPETYATCVLLLISSTWAFLSWLNDQRSWKLWLAVFLFAFLSVNRAPTVAFSVAFVGVLLTDPGARRVLSKGPLRQVAVAAGVALVPLIIMLASLWMRDVPGSGFNYLDHAYASIPEYPPGNQTISDKIERLWWLVSAKQFDFMFHPTLGTIKAQARWLLYELGWQYWPLMLAAFGVMALGVGSLWRQNRSVCLFVLLMIPAGVTPILLIRVFSHTTLLPNLLLPLAWLFGLGLTRIMRWHRSAAWQAAAVTVVCGGVWLTAEASFLRTQVDFDARDFIRAVDLESFPPDATLLTSFDLVSLIYVQQVDNVRRDIGIWDHGGRMTRAFLEAAPGRVFTTRAVSGEFTRRRLGDRPVWEILWHEDASRPAAKGSD